MDRTLAELEELVRNRICGVCSDRKMDGTCGLEEPGQCALFRLFPQVAEAIQTTHSDNIEDYIGAPSGGTCARCVRRRIATASCEVFARKCSARWTRICCWWWKPSKKPPARISDGRYPTGQTTGPFQFNFKRRSL
jgi:hypothetical protein